MTENSRDLHILVLKEAKELPSEKSFVLIPMWETKFPAKQVLLVLEDNIISPAIFIESCQKFIQKWQEMYTELLVADAFVEYKDTTFFLALSFITKREDAVSVKRLRREVPDTFYNMINEVEHPTAEQKEEINEQQIAIDQLSREEQLLKTKLFDVNNTVAETRTVISQLIGEVQKMNKNYNSQLEQVHTRLQNAMSYSERLEARMLANEEDAKHEAVSATDRIPRMKLKARETYAPRAEREKKESQLASNDSQESSGYTPPMRGFTQPVANKEKNPVDIWWEQQHRQTTTQVVPPTQLSAKQPVYDKPFVTAAATQRTQGTPQEDTTFIDDWLTEPNQHAVNPTLQVADHFRSTEPNHMDYSVNRSDEELGNTNSHYNMENDTSSNHGLEPEELIHASHEEEPDYEGSPDVYGPSNEKHSVSDYEHEAITTQAKDLFSKAADNEEVERIKVRTIDFDRYTEGLDYLEYQWHQIIENDNFDAFSHLFEWCEPFMDELQEFMDSLNSEVKRGFISKKYVQMPQRIMYSLQAYNLMGRYLEEVHYEIEK